MKTNKTNPKIKCDVRWAIRRDLEQVVALDYGEYGEDYDLLDMIKDKGIGLIVACPTGSDRVVGYAMYHSRISRFDLLRVVVDEDFRRMGIGKALVSKMKAKCRSSSRSALRVDVADDRLGAHLFLQQQKFRAIYVGQDQIAFSFVKPLRPKK